MSTWLPLTTIARLPVRRLACVLLLVPIVLVAGSEPAVACSSDLDPTFASLGFAQLAGDRAHLLSNGAVVVNVPGATPRRDLYDPDGRRLFSTTENVNFSHVAGHYFVNGRRLGPNGTTFGMGFGLVVGASEAGAWITSSGVSVDIYRSDGTIDTRYPHGGVLPDNTITLGLGPGAQPVGASFDGDVITVHMLLRGSTNADDSEVWTVTISPNGISHGAHTRFASGSAWSSQPLAGDPTKSLLGESWAIRAGEPAGFFVDWAAAGSPRVVPLVVGMGTPSHPIAAGDGSGWFLALVLPDNIGQFTFVNAAGQLDPSIGTFTIPGAIFLSDASPAGTRALRFAQDDRLYQFKGGQTPSDYLISGLTHQVTRLYTAGFGRAPDAPGLLHWRQQRASGRTLQSMAAAFIASPEFQTRFGELSNSAFVEQLYRFVLRRSADAGGLTYWTQRLDSGDSRATMLVEFSESPENVFRTGTLPADEPGAGVYRLYRAYFEREPDVAGICFYTLPHGPAMSISALVRASNVFAGSAEFRNRYGAINNDGFVRLVYQNVLGRSPDAAGLAYWTGQLGRGLTRGQLMVGFSESPEFRMLTDTVPVTN